MPVLMVRVDQSGLQQQAGWQTDLEKLYGASWAAVLPAQAANVFLAAALFNDHLLGAVKVTEAADGWWLSNLQVRPVTRQRGVATRLLALLAAAANQQRQPLWVATAGLTDAQQAFFLQRGFQQNAGHLLLAASETC